MAIQVGDRFPSATAYLMDEGGIEAVGTDKLLAGKKVVIFGLPGAFTPTCSAKHLPGFVERAEAIHAKGVDAIICLSVNDPFVMGAWAEQQNVGDKVVMLSDGNGDLAKALGLELDGRARGLGIRSQRFAMVVEDGVVKHLAVEENPAGMEVSGADSIIERL